jgi:hypothetical protein
MLVNKDKSFGGSAKVAALSLAILARIEQLALLGIPHDLLDPKAIFIIFISSSGIENAPSGSYRWKFQLRHEPNTDQRHEQIYW